MLKELTSNTCTLRFSPILAAEIGVDKALFLHRLHYYLKKRGKEANGQRWICHTLQQWHNRFKFWGIRKVERIIRQLEQSELIESGFYHPDKLNRTKCYTINEGKLAELINKIALKEQAALAKLPVSREVSESLEFLNLVE